MEMINLKINGIAVSVPKGSTILEAARAAGVCKNLLNYSIVEDKCKGCTLCARKCPVGAIVGTVKNPHTIDTTKCIKCGACMDSCKFGAIIKG